MPALGLADEPIPLWWTSDFILSSPEGTPEKEEKWIVGEFNCSCVGISKCLPAYCKDDTPNACYNDIPKKDLAEVKKMGDMCGKKALSILAKGAAQERSSKALESLKLILKSVDPKLADNDSLVEKLSAWKRS
mmetsp:Transcript_53749/g.158197  ORF Transcript_53749/g.158197 Transcript_53749/m.158197 type:complete len:133 (+) Transcript_53749:1-399(+)